jgi:predicted  nucleic acid-binding Zn-ribbon protein
MAMINEIFLNDQADTMREATLLYDQRVFREELLRGVEKIYLMIGQLSQAMKALEFRLIEVKNEVANINYELNTISNQLYDVESAIERAGARQEGAVEQLMYQQLRAKEEQRELYRDLQQAEGSRQKTLEGILNETQATRYAMQAVQDSNRKYEWYIQQHNQGLL